MDMTNDYSKLMALCTKLVEKVNEHKHAIEDLTTRLTAVEDAVKELSKPKSRARSKKPVEPPTGPMPWDSNEPQQQIAAVPTTLSEPITPVEEGSEDMEVPFDQGSATVVDPDKPIKEFPDWDGVEFPVIRGGIELTAEVIAKIVVEFRMGGANAAYMLHYPAEAIDYVLGLDPEKRRAIINRYYPADHLKDKKDEE